MERRLGDDDVPPLYLPPRELWRFNPDEDERLPTPVDERGLVDVEKLINLVKITVDPAFTWRLDEEPNKHHLYWRKAFYPVKEESLVSPHEFRNLAVNKVLIPRAFHNWLHRVTDEPPVPSEEVMHYRVEAQRVALELFKSARRSKRLIRLDKLSDTELEERLTRNFEEFSASLERANAIPEEYRLINPSDYKLETARDIHAIGHRLGELAIRCTTTRVRDVLRPLAA
jgi:hypothetical protein